MKTDTGEKIVTYIQEHNQTRIQDLVDYLHISHVAVHKQLIKLIQKGLIKKVGKAPIVFYTQADTIVPFSIQDTISEKVKLIIEQNFLSITPDGRLLYGLIGFHYWVTNYAKKTSYEQLAKEYAKTVQDTVRTKQGLIDATNKMLQTFSTPVIDALLYQEVYSYPLFGRTKLAKLVMQSKQSENKALIADIAELSKPYIQKIINSYHITAVGFIPPTVPRPLQFMDELKKQLHIELPHIDLVKIISGDIPIPQKSLSTVEERIINARSSIYPKKNTITKYSSVLLIDDVAGSGASFHETAKKLKQLKIGSRKIIAYAIVGNRKGYEVIRQI